ncbi:MAG TPA: hypothetical protein VGG06_27290, partial [Thermoanaerobaculia bacterium]
MELAEEALDRARRIFAGNGLMAEVAEITISQAHLSTLRGASPREFLQGFLAAHEENLEIPTRIIWMMKRTLVGALLYHHSG